MAFEGAILSEQVKQDKFTIHNYEVDNVKRMTLTIDTNHIKPNHLIYEFNPSDMMIRPAEVIDVSVLFTSRHKYIEVLKKPGCIYTVALNSQNAERRIKKRLKIS